MNIVEAAVSLRPGTAWNFDGKNIVQADDGTPRVAPPSSAELQQVIDANAYKERRVYPPIGDQLDAMWKGGADYAAMKAKIEAVKAAHPKP